MSRIAIQIQKTCQHCSTIFIPKINSIVRRHQAKFCSNPCKYQSRIRIFADFFWNNIDKTTSECWLWIGTIPGTNGYANIWWQEKHKYVGVHRVSYELAYGECPSDLLVCHTCDVPLCVNPNHLFLGTSWDNTQDAIQKGRMAPVKRGTETSMAKLTEKQVQEIRIRRNAGEPMTALAKFFNVDPTTIWAIIHRKSWKHLP